VEGIKKKTYGKHVTKGVKESSDGKKSKGPFSSGQGWICHQIKAAKKDKR
jgi:hypothetical protein